MFIIKRKQTRPSADIPFFHETPMYSNDYRKYLYKNFMQTGKLVSMTAELSDDKLCLYSTSSWESVAAFTEFFDDKYCNDTYLRICAEYEQVNGIVTISESEDGIIPVWKKIDPDEYFKDIVIPDTWATLEDFVEWYLAQRMPLMIPWNTETIMSDDACAICIFKKPPYQIELYIEYPNMFIRKHSHPRMEVITMALGGGERFQPTDSKLNTGSVWGSLTLNLRPGNYHGGDATESTGKGFAILAFQKWENPDEMTSAAIQWKGEIQGPIQAKLIKRHYPNAYVRGETYADITINQDDVPPT